MNSEKLKKEIEKRINMVKVIDPVPILLHLLSNHVEEKSTLNNGIRVNYNESNNS